MARAAVPLPRPEELRRELHSRIAPGGDLRAEVAALVAAAEAPADLDDLVALATTLNFAGGGDHLLLAVTRWLRSLTGAGRGWGDDEDIDVAAAREALVVAAAEEPDEIELLLNLGARLGVLDRLSGAFSDAAEAVRALGGVPLGYPQRDGSVVLLDGAGAVTVEAAPPARCRIVGEDLASHRQLIELAGRERRPVTADPVFVAAGDQPSFDVLVLRRAFYPRSTGLGGTIEDVGGPGTAAEVRKHVGASMLHLDCPVGEGGVLRLAEGTTLDPATLVPGEVSPGGVVVLPAGDYDFAALADAFLAAGHVSVIGWRRPVPGRVAALAGFLLHGELADRSRDPADAVRAVRSWLADPDRVLPDYLPPGYASVELTDPAYPKSLAHRGV